MKLICNIHGISEHKQKKRSSGDVRWICKDCEYYACRKYLANLKLKAIKAGGGECQICGYDKCWRALHFHHVDPSKKEFAIFEGRPGHKKVRSWEKLKIEIAKCILLCSNCHTELHDNEPKKNSNNEKKYNFDRTTLSLMNKAILSGIKTFEDFNL